MPEHEGELHEPYQATDDNAVTRPDRQTARPPDRQTAKDANGGRSGGLVESGLTQTANISRPGGVGGVAVWSRDSKPERARPSVGKRRDALRQRVADYVAAHPGCTGHDIRDAIGGNRSTLLAALRQLGVEGTVTASRDPSDQRIILYATGGQPRPRS